MYVPSISRTPARRSLAGREPGRDHDSPAKNILGTIEGCIPALRRYAAALLRDREAADDAVHQCLNEALDKLHTLQTDGDVKPRLFAILQHALGKRLAQKRFRPLDRAMPASPALAPGGKPGQDDSARQLDLMRRLDRLPEWQRCVLLLVSVENLTYGEAATVLKMSTSSVMELLASGRERLLQTDGAPPPEPGFA